MSRILRQLFSHETCSRLRYQPSLRPPRIPGRLARNFSSTSMHGFIPGIATEPAAWNPRQTWLPPEKFKELEKYPMVTSDGLKGRQRRPRRVKMLLRDFIEGRHYQHSGA
jgi:hypothetical protein